MSHTDQLALLGFEHQLRQSEKKLTINRQTKFHLPFNGCYFYSTSAIHATESTYLLLNNFTVKKHVNNEIKLPNSIIHW